MKKGELGENKMLKGESLIHFKLLPLVHQMLLDSVFDERVHEEK